MQVIYLKKKRDLSVYDSYLSLNIILCKVKFYKDNEGVPANSFTLKKVWKDNPVDLEMI